LLWRKTRDLSPGHALMADPVTATRRRLGQAVTSDVAAQVEQVELEREQFVSSSPPHAMTPVSTVRCALINALRPAMSLTSPIL
jgi:hypothetical protein